MEECGVQAVVSSRGDAAKCRIYSRDAFLDADRYDVP